MATCDGPHCSVLDHLKRSYWMFEERSGWKPDWSSVAQDWRNQGPVGEEAIFLTEAPVSAHNRLDNAKPTPCLSALAFHVRSEGAVDVVDDPQNLHFLFDRDLVAFKERGTV
jgi:hypothetical protein